MPTFQERIGRRIRARRVLLGLQQQELAEVAAIPQEHISRYERGAFVSMHPERLAALARALKTTSDYLLGLSEDMESDLLPAGLAPVGA